MKYKCLNMHIAQKMLMPLKISIEIPPLLLLLLLMMMMMMMMLMLIMPDNNDNDATSDVVESAHVYPCQIC